FGEDQDSSASSLVFILRIFFPPGFRAKLNRSECARREQSRLSEAFCGTVYLSDCSVPPGHSLVHSTLASTPERGKSQGRVPEMVPPLSCKCRHRAGCNEKGCRRPPQSCPGQPQPIS